jgi:hypothetical protein
MGVETALLVGGGLGAAGSFLGGQAAERGAERGAEAQERAAILAAQTQERLFERGVALQEPFRQLALGRAQQLTPAETQLQLGQLGRAGRAGARLEELAGMPFELSDAFRIQQEEGERAIARGASARGLQRSGATLGALSQFNRRLLAGEAESFRGRQLGILGGLAGAGGGVSPLAGAGIAQALGQQATGVGGTLAGLQMGAGQARAQGLQQAAQARGQGISGAFGQGVSALGTFANIQAQQNMLKQLGFAGPMQ